METDLESIKREAEEGCFFCGPHAGHDGSSVLDEGKKWANCLRSLYGEDHGNKEDLAEMLEDATYCLSCVQEFRKLEDLLFKLENLRLQLDLIKRNYKTKLNRTLESAKDGNRSGTPGLEKEQRKREAVFEYMNGRPGTEFSEISRQNLMEPIVLLEEGDSESSSGESSGSPDFAPSEDHETDNSNAASDADEEIPLPRAPVRAKRGRPPGRKCKASSSPLEKDLRSKHKIKDAVVKVERLSVPKNASSSKSKAQSRIGTKYKKFHECPICEVTFKKSTELKAHEKSHKARDKDVPCKVSSCGELFENAIDRNAHIKEVHPDYKPFQCRFCLRSFTAKQTLQDHENSHTNATPYSCSECGKTFINRSRLHRHMRKHGGRRNFLCDKCEKAFFTIQDLQRHIRVHTNERPFICEFCGRSFTAAIYLRDHLPSHPESNLAKPLCKFCGKVFVSSVYLMDHEKTHVGDFKFWCDKCSFGATKKFKLDRHMLTHIETREFECQPCNKKYKSSLDLKTHNKLVHSDMDFICSTCNKVFTSRFYLLRHTKIHTSEKNFSCSICGYSFAVRRYLRVHMKKYHPQESHLKRGHSRNNVLAAETITSFSYNEFVPEAVTGAVAPEGLDLV